jgi:hypothetical protein
MTINEVLVLMKAIRDRLSQLKSLVRDSSSATRYFGDAERIVEPKYDGKAIDKKVVELEIWLFKADAAIKQANAVTKVNVEADVDKLLAPVE